MDIGDSPAGQLGTVYVFTNAERVDLYKNDVFVTTLHKSGWTALPHPPLAVDDTIGELLETQERFDKAKADTLRLYGELYLYMTKSGRSFLRRIAWLQRGLQMYKAEK